jgi:hypothetical protein
MKMKAFLGATLLFALMFGTGCQKAKNLLDFTFEADYSVDIPVTIPESAAITSIQDQSFDKQKVIDPSSNKQVSKYLKKIKKWEVKSIKGSFKNVSKEVQLVSGTISFATDGGSVSWTFHHLTIKNGNGFDLGNQNGELDKLGDLMMTNKPFKVTVSGITDQVGFSFVLTMDIKSKITASPL